MAQAKVEGIGYETGFRLAERCAGAAAAPSAASLVTSTRRRATVLCARGSCPHLLTPRRACRLSNDGKERTKFNDDLDIVKVRALEQTACIGVDRGIFREGHSLFRRCQSGKPVAPTSAWTVRPVGAAHKSVHRERTDWASLAVLGHTCMRMA